MKKKNYFLCALATLLFAACSEDSAITDDGIVTNPKGDAWVALNISTPSAVRFRGLNSDDKQDGTEEESGITTVRAIFFDAADNVTDDVQLTAAEAGNPGQPNGGVSDPFQVSASSTRILIVANPGADFPIHPINSGTNYSIVNAALSVTDGDVSTNVAKNGSFMMSNAKGSLEPSNSDGTDATLKLYKTKELASGSPLAVNIDRVVSKVRVYIETISDIATVSNPFWVLNVTNKKFFPASERTLTWNEDSSNPDARGTCITPFDQYKIGSYRKDPNYDSSNQNTTDYVVVSDDSKITNAPGASQYCLENTQTADYNEQQYTTQVLLKANFVPKKYAQPNSTDSLDAEVGGDWIKINSGFYTFTSLKKWIEVELRYKYDNDGNAKPSVTTILTDALNAYLDAKVEGAVPLQDTGVDVDDLVLAFNAKIDAIKGKGAGSVGAFNYYAGGLNYYKIIIKHDDTDKASNELGEFGVTRNSVYDIKVTKFKNPGYPEIPTPGTDPDEEDGSYLAIQINVNPWTWYTQTEEL
ncbi:MULTISPECIES: Mfa1 family fimbria major subunit [Parabacteroides]|uniref:Mfa1 family fimbria major subunit n=1 Tax=Parabacteroides leei TaxID=2939491 RepID=UPI001899B577|nr:Mfa1 family fimbria major subunit [Parabacteroides goldsteinii]